MGASNKKKKSRKEENSSDEGDDNSVDSETSEQNEEIPRDDNNSDDNDDEDESDDDNDDDNDDDDENENEEKQAEKEKDSNDDDDDDDDGDNGDGVDSHDDNDDDEEEEEEEDDDDEKEGLVVAQKPKKVHRLSLTETENFNEKLKKRGVLYIARIPPKMTPTKIKSLLSDFCEVTRVYLVPEDASVRKRRKKEYGRSGGKRYVEGWVELASKKKAKHIAQSLNNTPISNHKRNPHYGDLWNLKYLSKFKWSHLTEKVAYERRVREQKLRVEMMQARRENAAYVQMVETGKKLDKIEARKRKREGTGASNGGNNGGGGGDGDNNNNNNNNNKSSDRRHKHRQTKPLHDGSDKAAKKALLGGLV